MKLIILLTSMLLFNQQSPSVYSFKIKTIDGRDLDLSTFKGKKILIVNTASKCGFTPQYEDLEKLSQMYQGKLIVIGFPANNFGGQEPGSNVDIQAFCKKNYGVTFTLAEKSSVKGDDIHPLFDFLTHAENSDFTGDIKWNFEKFLIDENGKLIHRFRSKVEPLSAEITDKI